MRGTPRISQTEVEQFHHGSEADRYRAGGSLLPQGESKSLGTSPRVWGPVSTLHKPRYGLPHQEDAPGYESSGEERHIRRRGCFPCRQISYYEELKVEILSLSLIAAFYFSNPSGCR